MSQHTHLKRISSTLQLKEQQVAGALNLFAEGATIPFIARYRKEITGSLDEVALTAIREMEKKLMEVDQRRASIIDSMSESGVLSTSLRLQLEQAEELSALEDIYLPFRPKRKTRASMARDRGLEPLATLIFAQDSRPVDSEVYLSAELGVNSKEEALQGAADIIAEWLSEDRQSRQQLRRLFQTEAIISSQEAKASKKDDSKFKDYFAWQEVASKTPSHRLLAMFRGETEKELSLSLRPDTQKAFSLLCRLHLKKSPWQGFLQKVVADSYERLLAPSLENELRKELKEAADTEAIEVFGRNLRQLLLAPPLGQKRVMALDPGYRTGAKLVCLDETGQLLHSSTIYPVLGEEQQLQAARDVTELVNRFDIEAIAIGDGTAGRETEKFVRNLNLTQKPAITLVNEDGASIYSASEIARQEFPDLDLTVRGAVSIGRRLQDPLAELVKLDPKSIGVGQYQHDVHQGRLMARLGEVVESCVNSVGVELNSASGALLAYVSGLSRAQAANIVKRRDTHGPFSQRSDLLQVPRLGPKAYEQAAGFLRISNGKNPLDNSAVHPERYSLVEKMAADNSISVADLLSSSKAREKIDLGRYCDNSIGLETLNDILAELAKPSRDPRESFETFQFAEGIDKIEDLEAGMILPAIITNITKFGAFADVGVKQDGLIHISQLADRFIKDPGEVVQLGQRVRVKVQQVDLGRRRIALSLRGLK